MRVEGRSIIAHSLGSMRGRRFGEAWNVKSINADRVKTLAEVICGFMGSLQLGPYLRLRHHLTDGSERVRRHLNHALELRTEREEVREVVRMHLRIETS